MACVRSRSIFTGTLTKLVLQACLCPPRWNQRNSNLLYTPYARGYPPEIPGFPTLPPRIPSWTPGGSTGHVLPLGASLGPHGPWLPVGPRLGSYAPPWYPMPRPAPMGPYAPLVP